jgi:hypothetical protein
VVRGIELELDDIADFGEGYVGFECVAALKEVLVRERERMGGRTRATAMVCVIIEEVVEEASVELAAAESVEVMEESVVSWARTRVAPRRSSGRSMLMMNSSRTSGKIKQKGSTSDGR